MEKSTKNILWIVAFITLPVTIPLTIISVGIVASAIFLIMGIICMYPVGTMIVIVCLVILAVLNKQYPVQTKTEY